LRKSTYHIWAPMEAMNSINYWNLIKIVWVLFKKITIVYFGAYLRGPSFWTLNAQIYWAQIQIWDGKPLEYQPSVKSVRLFRLPVPWEQFCHVHYNLLCTWDSTNLKLLLLMT
jgi:hypothetical protein